MITGFNTDIDYQGVTYHVQTEDKGLTTPLILSLVYDRGTILASKRSPYDDLLGGDFDEKVLTERLQKQHSLICAAIRAGRIEDLKRMTMKESASKKKGLIAQKEIRHPQPEAIQKPEAAPVNVPPAAVQEKIQPPKPDLAEPQPAEIKPAEQRKEEIPPPPQLLHKADERFDEIRKPEVPMVSDPKIELPLSSPPIPKPDNSLLDVPISIGDQDLILDEVEVIEEVMILPAEAVEIITDFAKYDEPTDNSLTVELLNETTFKSGETKTISVLVGRGKMQSNMNGASVMVKVLGSNFRPLIFHSKTDSNGVAIIQIQLPHFSRGRGAILIKAISGNEEADLRRVIQPG